MLNVLCARFAWLLLIARTPMAIRMLLLPVPPVPGAEGSSEPSLLHYAWPRPWTDTMGGMGGMPLLNPESGGCRLLSQTGGRLNHLPTRSLECCEEGEHSLAHLGDESLRTRFVDALIREAVDYRHHLEDGARALTKWVAAKATEAAFADIEQARSTARVFDEVLANYDLHDSEAQMISRVLRDDMSQIARELHQAAATTKDEDAETRTLLFHQRVAPVLYAASQRARFSAASVHARFWPELLDGRLTVAWASTKWLESLSEAETSRWEEASSASSASSAFSAFSAFALPPVRVDHRPPLLTAASAACDAYHRGCNELLDVMRVARTTESFFQAKCTVVLGVFGITTEGVPLVSAMEVWQSDISKRASEVPLEGAVDPMVGVALPKSTYMNAHWRGGCALASMLSSFMATLEGANHLGRFASIRNVIEPQGERSSASSRSFRSLQQSVSKVTSSAILEQEGRPGRTDLKQTIQEEEHAEEEKAPSEWNDAQAGKMQVASWSKFDFGRLRALRRKSQLGPASNNRRWHDYPATTGSQAAMQKIRTALATAAERGASDAVRIIEGDTSASANYLGDDPALQAFCVSINDDQLGTNFHQHREMASANAPSVRQHLETTMGSAKAADHLRFGRVVGAMLGAEPGDTAATRNALGALHL